MTYTGHVTPDGPADVRELDEATIRKVSVGELDNCCYLVTCRATGTQLLIDAADNADRLVGLIEESGPRLDLVLTTHRHWDHHRALARVVQRTGATTMAGVDDADAIPVPTDRALVHGEEFDVGRLRMRVTQLRGHTPGSIAVACWAGGSTHLFSGDSLFPGGLGNTQGDSVRFADLLRDVEERVFAVYDDDTWVYPGHGADTTLGTERPALPEWRARGW